MVIMIPLPLWLKLFERIVNETPDFYMIAERLVHQKLAATE